MLAPILNSLKFEPLIFVAQIVLFLALWAFLSTTFWKPHLSNLNARDRRVTDAHTQQQQLQLDMEDLRNDYMTRIGQIEAEARLKISSAVKEAQEERERIVKETRAHSETTMAQGIANFEREKVEAMSSLQSQMIQIASEAAGKALGNSADSTMLRNSIEKRVLSGIAAGNPANN